MLGGAATVFRVSADGDWILALLAATTAIDMSVASSSEEVTASVFLFTAFFACNTGLEEETTVAAFVAVLPGVGVAAFDDVVGAFLTAFCNGEAGLTEDLEILVVGALLADLGDFLALVTRRALPGVAEEELRWDRISARLTSTLSLCRPTLQQRSKAFLTKL